MLQTDFALSLASFDPDVFESPVVSLHVDVQINCPDLPLHKHRRAQMIMPVRGEVSCHVAGRVWLVPAQAALWIPSGVPHAAKVSDYSSVYFSYAEPALVEHLPQSCCMLSVSPLIEELVKYIATAPHDKANEGSYPHAVALLLNQLGRLPVEQASFALPDHPKLRRIAQALLNAPADRRSVAEWAEMLAMSERTLERLFVAETGMTFGRFRQQLQLSLSLQLLARGLTVESVGAAVGYESASAFITMFKKQMGDSPRRYAANWKVR